MDSLPSSLDRFTLGLLSPKDDRWKQVRILVKKSQICAKIRRSIFGRFDKGLFLDLSWPPFSASLEKSIQACAIGVLHNDGALVDQVLQYSNSFVVLGEV